MLIVSQDKKIVININRIYGYSATGNEIRAFDGSEEYFVLGMYETEQRAMEILIDVCGRFNDPMAIMHGVIEMPEK